MQFSVVDYKTVRENSDFRVDAEYYHPTALRIHQKIKSRNGVSFFDMIKSISSGQNLPQSKHGQYKFIRTQNIRPILIDDSGMSQTDDLESLKPTKEGELLFVRVGEGVGNSSVVTKCYSGNAISDNVLRLKIEGINPFFCSAFFNSKHGQDYFRRVFKGTARSLISQENFRDILIPLFNDGFQKTIQNLIEESQSQAEISKHLYSQAEYILLFELGLLGWEPKHELTFVKNFSTTQGAERFDAEYFQPQYEDTIEAVKRYNGGFDELGNMVKIKTKNYTPKDPEQYKYIELANISSNGEITGYTEDFGSELPSRARRRVQKGDLIVSSIEGSLNSIALITEGWENALCSTGFFTLDPNEINSETLLVLLKTKVGQLQLKKGCRGTILTAVGKEELSKVILPQINAEIQKDVKRKISKMYETKKLSNELLEIAKQGVEIAIDKNDQEANKWINSKVADYRLESFC